VSISAGAVLAALLWSAVAGVATWFVLYPARRRWLAGLFVSVALTATAASIGALLGGIHAMLLPTQDWTTVVTLTVGAGAVAAVAATAAARRVASDNRALRLAVADLAEGRVPDPSGRPLTAELEGVRRELATTAAALAQTRDRERALELSRRELVSWVSHDLRTPLAGLRAMAEALEDGMVDDPAPYYKQIAASVDRLSGLVDDLFDLSRIQAGGIRQSADRVSLDDLVSDVLAALGPLAAARRIELTGRPSGGATVRGDAPQLDRAITNLVANAIRHTPDAGAVELAVTRDGAAVTVAVRDQCGGIAEADLPRVFDVGFRGEHARTARTGDGTAGAGLGLAIARGIVEAHHGTIAVSNTADGCRFAVTLAAE
jgi:signal transduction histidine kinase